MFMLSLAIKLYSLLRTPSGTNIVKMSVVWNGVFLVEKKTTTLIVLRIWRVQQKWAWLVLR